MSPDKPLHCAAVRPSKAVDLDTTHAAATALRVFSRIAARWNLSAAERRQLLGVSRAVCARWQAGQVDKPLTTGTM